MPDGSPVILVVGGNDPVGGAGLCADIQTLSALGCHTAPVLTAVTMQTTCGVTGFSPVDADTVKEQIACVLEDMPVAAIKTGMLATGSIASAVGEIAGQLADIPLVVDPVLASNTGNSLSERSLIDGIIEYLLPTAMIITPNLPELKALSAAIGCADDGLLAMVGSLKVDCLVTGTHDASTEKVINRLIRHSGETSEWAWDRLPGEFHGSGCTLAASLAAGLAQGAGLETAAEQAQAFTWQALNNGLQLGECQLLPNRISSRADRR